MSGELRAGDLIHFRTPLDLMSQTGTFLKCHKGNLLIRVSTTSAVGRLAVPTTRVVNPRDVLGVSAK